MRILLSLATALTILAMALVLLLTPVWTHFALSAAGSTAPDGDPIGASDRTVGDLLTLGDFGFEVGDQPMYTADERAHMRDVQVVLYGFVLVALVSAVFVVATIMRRGDDPTVWSAVARGGIGLAVVLLVLGIFAALAFETAFTLFHEIFFPGGNWAFPADSNLIRLYPEAFWELSSAALGVLSIVGGLVVWLLARRQAAARAA